MIGARKARVGIGKFGSEASQKKNGVESREYQMAASNRIGREFSLSAKVLNAALMDFGSAMCVGKPKCAACPLQKQCRYYREHGSRENARQAEGKQKSKSKQEIVWRL